MYHNKIYKNYEKGVSLIMTIFIMTIMLAIVLSIGILLYSQIKILRNIGDSVVAFYAADSGVEKVLYYDRRQIPVGGTGRGLCYMFDIDNPAQCSDCTPGTNGDCVESNCYNYSLTGPDCDPLTCSDCNITFSSEMNPGEHYNLDIVVKQQCKISTGTINSYGIYEEVSRAIRLDSATKVSSLVIPSSGATANFQGQTGVNMTISADVLDPNNVGIESVVAIITGLGAENENQCDPTPPLPFTECTYREVILTSGGGGTYSHPWNFGLQGVTYTISIFAYDNDGNCVEASNIEIIYQ